VSERINRERRALLEKATLGVTAVELMLKDPTAQANVTSSPASSSRRLEPLKHIDAGVLNIGYYEEGPGNGPVVILLHGFPYDVHAYVDVVPLLTAKGCRTIVPYLRGFGPTRFRDKSTPRSGEQAAMGADVIALMDAIGVKRAILCGYDWGGRGACVAAALWPDRCAGLVSVNGYNIIDISRANIPAKPEREAAIWYQFYFHSERGRAGLTTYRREIGKLLWRQWSPKWAFEDATFERTAAAYDNPDYVDVVVHSYRHRFGLAEGDPQYADLERRLASLPPIQAPAITLDGDSDGVIPASDGKASAPRFKGPRTHRIVAGAGHNLPQEAPEAFAGAILELIAAP
jgi:pimeloyl-ACP methyl ester carboxylesterase